MDYENMKTGELRRLAREKAPDDSRTRLLSTNARKADLIAFLTNGTPLPERFGPDLGDDEGLPPSDAPKPAVPAVPEGDAAAKLAELIRILMPKGGKVDEAAIRRIVDEKFNDWRKPVEVVLVKPSGETVPAGIQHKLFPRVLKLVECAAVARKHVMLVGPAGSGKTECAIRAGEALFGAGRVRGISLSPQTPVSALMGYMDATGRYVGTGFRDIYENGGLFYLDEIDNGNEQTLGALNSALSNGALDFPDKRVERNAKVVIVATANTFGTGADALYVGRNRLDAATLDRFARVPFGYDEALEEHITLAAGGDTATTRDWLERVREVRRAVEELKERIVVSPRASMAGAAYLANDVMGIDEATDCLLFPGVNDATKRKVMDKAALL